MTYGPGKTGVIICGHCQLPCEQEVFERVHYFVGREHEAVITQFCSKECEDQHSGVDARIKEMVEREVRTELNLMRKFMCPKDLQRFKRYVE